MLKRIRAFFIKRRAQKTKNEANTIYTYSHILLSLFNNLKLMKTISEKQKRELFDLYANVLYNSMKDENKVLFTKAILETNASINKLYSNIPDSQVEIKRQLDEIFRSSN